MKRPLRVALCFISAGGIALLVLVTWLVLSGREEAKLRPPPTMETIEDFLAQMPAPQQIKRFEFDGKTFFEIFGQLGGTIRLPSGPPAYVFDSQGRFVAWTADRGDDGPYFKRWGRFQNSTNISLVDLASALDSESVHEP